MPRSICRLALLLLPIADAAAAGAWPRAEDSVFLSLSSERDGQGNRHTGFYGEYGLSRRNTLGLQLDHASAGETGALIWLQRALDDGAGRSRWTVSLGLGAIERDGTLLPVGQVGAAWGRGIEGFLGGGWLTVETRLKVAGATKEDAFAQAAAGYAGYLANLTPEVAAKADVTLGLHLSPAMMLVNQLRLEEGQDTGFSARLSTSVVHDLAGRAKVELGLVMPLAGTGEQALKIGTWLEF